MSNTTPPKFSAYIATSLDGYIAGTNDELDWLSNFALLDEDYGYQAFADNTDAMLIGRKTYQTILGFSSWPYPHKRVIVLSSQQLKITIPNVELFNGSFDMLLTFLAKENLHHVYVDGGITISQFLNRGLLNQLIISIMPIILGEGKHLFKKLKNKINLELINSKTFTNGVVQLSYTAKY